MEKNEKLYRIVDISEEDSFFEDRETLIGRVGKIEDLKDWGDGWFWGYFIPVGHAGDVVPFFEFKFEEVIE